MNGEMTTRQIVDYYRTHSPKIDAINYLAERNGVPADTIEDILANNNIDLRYIRKMKNITKEKMPEKDLPWVIPVNENEVDTSKVPVKDTEENHKYNTLTEESIKAKAYEAVLAMLNAKVTIQCIDFYCAAIEDVICWMEDANGECNG